MIAKDLTPILDRAFDRTAWSVPLTRRSSRMAQVVAQHQKHGALVIRAEEEHFTVELGEDVPFGDTEELECRITYLQFGDDFMQGA